MKFYAAVCAFCQIEQIKGGKNPISKLAQLFFFKLNKWKEEKIQLKLGLKMFVKKSSWIQSLSKLLVLPFIEWNCAIQIKYKARTDKKNQSQFIYHVLRV